jgi:hypothetical protein
MTIDNKNSIQTDKRYRSNPFLEDFVVNTKAKQVKISSMGKDENILVNQATGEVKGTHVITYKRVDEQQFVKLFTANIALTFDLKAAGIKAFNVLLWAVQHMAMGRDLITLDNYTLQSFLHSNNQTKLSESTFRRGVRDLVTAQIIAKSTRLGYYFINPNFVFNGDRVAFTTALEKIAPEEQLDMLDEQSDK